MKALILAAGRGERLRPLTDHCPKPLLSVGGKPMLQWHVEALVKAGVRELVINHAWHGEQIEDYFTDGTAFGASIVYSREGDKALETGGGIRRALPLLGETPFIVVNGDIVTDYPFARLLNHPVIDAHLVLVKNPPHHARGDFILRNGIVYAEDGPRLTYSGIGLYHPAMFIRLDEGIFPLAPILRASMAQGRIHGEHYAGAWIDVGTVERLHEADRWCTGS